jgi:putative FmdB family regulatory protein
MTMPIYRLKCDACGEEFEDFRNISEKEEKGSCLACGSGEIKRIEVMVTDCDCGCGCSEVKADFD